MHIHELAPWDGSVALLLDGGSGPAQRPPLHLQAAAGGHLRLVGPNGPVLWGLVESGYWGVDIVRATRSELRVLPPIRMDEARGAPGSAGTPEFVHWWTRHFAPLLCASTASPIVAGRRFLLETISPTFSTEMFRRDRLDELLEQRDEFELDWDFTSSGLLLTRPLSDANDGRVKAWRKAARDMTLPPLLTWWCRGLYAHVLLDGHDRVHAALLEGLKPDVIVLGDVTPAGEQDMNEHRSSALNQAASFERITVERGRAIAMNTALRAAWEPRAEWTQATPGFPLDGGIERWRSEVRGTSLDPERLTSDVRDTSADPDRSSK